MLDLKAQLLKAGLVDEEAVERVEQEQLTKRERNQQRKHAQSERARWNKRVDALISAGKAEQYDTIRGWVQRTRLDPEKGLPSEDADRFHFETEEGRISWLTLEPDHKAKIAAGDAGIVAFMSHNGLKHCLVPRDVAIDIGRVRADWLRHLERYDRPAPPEAQTPEAQTPEAQTPEAQTPEAQTPEVQGSAVADHE